MSTTDSPKGPEREARPEELEDLRYELDRRREDCDRVRQALVPILAEHPLSKDEVGHDAWERRLRAGYVARIAADVLRWYAEDVSRLREQLEAQTQASDGAVMEVLRERDDAVDWADKLAYAVAPVEVIGEHSNLNNPWANALAELEISGYLTVMPKRPRVATPVATSEASPIVHTVLLSSDTGVMGEWQAFCSGCRQRSVGDLAHAEFWKDQHLADVLVPQLQANSKLEQILDEGRPSGSTAAPHSGVELIAAERARQVDVEGWTPEHDAEHDNDSLARAAACYALPRRWRDPLFAEAPCPPKLWPWDAHYWKPIPADRVRELVKAGALLAAEIDRIQAQDAAQAAGSEATQFVCSEHIWDAIPCPNCEPRELPSPSLRKEGEDSD